MVICIQKHPNELYMVTTPPFINPMNVYVLTAIMTKNTVLTVKPICALTEQISAVFENTFSAQSMVCRIFQQSEISHDTIATFQMTSQLSFIAFHINYANV